MGIRHNDGRSEELDTVRAQAERMVRVRWKNENRLVFTGRKPWATTLRNAADKHANITIRKY